MVKWLWLLLVSLLVCVSCVDDRVSESGLNAAGDAAGDPVWLRYTSGLDRNDLQSECLPQMRRSKGTVFKGSVILVHGFTACPQQYFDLSDKLVPEGFDVYMPLLPGHGHKVDYKPGSALLKKAYEAMPNFDQGPGAFVDFVRFLVELGHSLQPRGPVSIAGLSVGGLMVAMALQSPGQVFERGVIMTPFFGVKDGPGIFLEALQKVKAVAKFAGGGQSLLDRIVEEKLFRKETGWGEVCEVSEKERAGYCRFWTGHVALLQGIGTGAKTRRLQGNTEALLIGVDDDQAVSEEAIRNFARSNGFAPFGADPSRRACFFERGVNHSLLSKYDSPNEVKFWKPSLENALVAFIAEGKGIPVAPTPKEDFLRCFPDLRD